MRGIYTPVIDIRRKVFTEVARMSYEGGNYAEKMTTLPFKIVPGEIGKLRHNIFLERAIVSERIRLAMGLPLRPVDTQMPASAGVEHSAIAEKYYDPPLGCPAGPSRGIHAPSEIRRTPQTPGSGGTPPRSRRENLQSRRW